jgi:hypothetical protein
MSEELTKCLQATSSKTELEDEKDKPCSVACTLAREYRAKLVLVHVYTKVVENAG